VGSSKQGSILDCIYEAIAHPRQWASVLTRVADQLGAVGGMLIHVPAPGKGRVIATYGRLDEEYGAIVRDRYAWNPWSRAMQHVSPNRAVIMNSLLEPGEIFKSGFYADVLRPQGVTDIMNFRHRALSEDGGIGGFGFCLSLRGAEHAHHNIRKMQRLVPHLSRALEGTLLLRHFADGTQQLAKM
jgi:hypothetical protein